jgi:hypothetical protein
MKRRILFFVLFPVFLSACATASPIPVIAPTLPPPTLIPIFTPTVEPVTLNLRVTGEVVNCRLGPGVVYELINQLYAGQSVRVVGRNDTSTWWYIRNPGNPNGFCWVAANVTKIQGEVEKLPIANVPFVTVTAALRAEPDRIVVNCSQFPQTIFLEAEITANGPAYVTWKWEASTGASSEEALLIFEGAGKQVINDYYQVGAPNDYWIKLHILAPNELVQQVNIPVNCTP